MIKKINLLHFRTKIVLINILQSSIVKILNVGLSIITVPITLEYLNKSIYGLWLTIYSVMTWLMFFDGGLGSGLKIKFTQAKADNDFEKIKYFVSTSYFILAFSSFIILFLFYFINPFINWHQLFNIDSDQIPKLNSFIFIFFSLFVLQFIFRLIDSILIADQRSGESDILNLISSLLSILLFLVFKNEFKEKLFFVGILFCGIPVIVNVIATIIFFLKRYVNVSPSVNFIKFSYYKELMNYGSKFFVIQICNLITISSMNLIISNVIDTESVVNYNISNKYYSFAILVFGVITNSLTTSFNDAYHRNDFEWIKNIVKKIKTISVYFILLIFLMYMSCSYVFKLWIGTNFSIPSNINLLMSLYNVVIIWFTVYATFINGIGKVKIAFLFSIINSIIFLPLTFIFGRTFGLEGIIISQIIIVSPGLYWLPKQYKLIINNKAKGIWNA